ncbi:MAG TPA: hypothetical protein VGN88_00735, partial [Phycisphaerae bacterium]
IGKGGLITLSLEPEVSDVVTDDTSSSFGSSSSSGAAPMPVVTRRHAKTVVEINDGETIMIGGLLRDSHRAVTDKIPVAGDIPGIGAAFRTVNENRERQEVVILITARLVDKSHTSVDKLTSRLQQRYVTPLDAIGSLPQGTSK